MARDEEVIRRRARFVAAAIALAGCSRDKVTVGPLPTGEAKGAGPKDATVADDAVPPPSDRPALTAELVPEATATPPVGVPLWTPPPSAKQRLADEVAWIGQSYNDIEKLAKTLPTHCDQVDAICRKRAADYVQRLFDTEEAIPKRDPCPAKTANDQAIEGLVTAHRTWLRRWTADIRAALDRRLSAATVQELWVEARTARPHPCLSIVCP